MSYTWDVTINRNDQTGNWSLYVNGVRWIHEESYTVVSNIQDYLVSGTRDNSECSDVAESIRARMRS